MLEKEPTFRFADWQKPSQYPDPEKTDGVQWMWQFLRRNRGYQRDYQVFIKTPSAHCLNLKNKGQKNRELYYKYLKDQKGFAKAAEIVWKWFPGYHELFDPLDKFPESIYFASSCSIRIISLPEGEGSFKYINPGGKVAIIVDLNYPLDEQIRRAKNYLKKEQADLEKQGKLNPFKRGQIKLYPAYLRLLDAYKKTKDLSEIGKIIFANEKSIKKVESGLLAAEQIRDHDFRYLPLVGDPKAKK